MTTGAFSLPLTDVHVPEEDVQAVLDCLRSGWLTMGPRTAAFEEAFAREVGAAHAVAVSSGTAALHLSLLAAGIGPGDEVLVPAITFVATAAAVRYVGAEPVLCDVLGAHEPSIDPADAARRVTSRTRAVLCVHFCGAPCDVPALEALCAQHDLVLLEDCAQAISATLTDGRPAGSAGALAAFSLFSKKQLCVGEGGVVVTADERAAARVRSLRSHAMTSGTWDRHRGHAESYDVVDVGFNFRIDEPRAALGLSRLPRLAGDIGARRAAVRAYRARLRDVPGVEVQGDDAGVERSSHFAFPVVFGDRTIRDGVREHLAAQGIQTTWYPALTTLTAYRGGAPCPRAEDAAARHAALPLAASTTVEQVEHVVAAIAGAPALRS